MKKGRTETGRQSLQRGNKRRRTPSTSKNKDKVIPCSPLPNPLLCCPQDILWEVLRCFKLKFVLGVLLVVHKSFRTCIRNGRRVWGAQVPREWMSQLWFEKIRRSVPSFQPTNLSVLRGDQTLAQFVSFSYVTQLRLVDPNDFWPEEYMQTLFASLPSLKSLHLQKLLWIEGKKTLLWAPLIKTLPCLEAIHLEFSESLWRVNFWDKTELSAWQKCFQDLPVNKVTTDRVDRCLLWFLLQDLPLTSLDLRTSCLDTDETWHAKSRASMQRVGRNLVELVTPIFVPELFSSRLTHLVISPLVNLDSITWYWNWDLILRQSPCLTHLSLSQTNVLDENFSFCKFPCLKSLTLGAAEWSMDHLKSFTGVRLTHLTVWSTMSLRQISGLWAFLFRTFPLVFLNIRGNVISTDDLMEDLKKLSENKVYASRLTLGRLHLCVRKTQLNAGDFDFLQTCFPALKTVRLPSKPAFEISIPNCETDQDGDFDFA